MIALACPINVISNSSDLQDVTNVVPYHVFCMRIAIPGLADGADIDNMPISRFERNDFLAQRVELKVFSVIAHEPHAVGMPGKGNIELFVAKISLISNKLI